VEVFLRLLQDLDAGTEPVTPERLREGVDALFALPDPRGDARLQLMTIHKAKGLEFDTVILPGLGKATQGDRRKLLYWQETVGSDGEVGLLFGPVKPAQSNREPATSAYIKQLQAAMGRLESGRLLYVAATRAKRHLHLLGHARRKQDGGLAVDKGSLLGQLWPAVDGIWHAAAAELPISSAMSDGEAGAAVAGPARWRLPAGWVCPEPPRTIGARREAAPETVDGVVYEWAGDIARAVGTVVHAWLQRLAQSPVGRLAELSSFDAVARRMLLREGVSLARIEPAARRVRAAVESALRDERGQWVLSARHEDSRCEVPVTALIAGQLRHLVIDRTFIDQDGTRWIIDYKTGMHEGGDVAGFLDEEEERYRGQLEAYAEAFRTLEDRPVRIALYYPLVTDGWREVLV
jgi:ATP-dependent exoDNAse (exonuclease V) beta subunit